ncbi:flagellar basal body L-ring protein FlgH [Malikia sp.]|uniref:flagellar basal body L-ring protein FlgH n=1 Tax=Malikia sp. TaxID=2070706 RepID=UPI00261A616E|nr:flagellar basal body L-ring protein FlgH [Malikia sp.]MDD2727864.1 flagellar basal body L-ring protein FlgH [Malikia sp.]
MKPHSLARRAAWPLLGALLAGCSAVEPTTILSSPTSTRPTAAPVSIAPSNGAIFQVSSFRPMFEDRRARAVGDILSVVISERSSANQGSKADATREGKAKNTVNSLPIITTGLNTLLGMDVEGKSKFSLNNNGGAKNDFNSRVAVTVIEVLSNGNLLISGEKQIGLDQGTEFVRISGVVAPSVIGPGNLVESQNVADARIEYRTNSQIDKAQLNAMMNRFFYSVLPL